MSGAPLHASPTGNEQVTQLSAELELAKHKIEQLESQLNTSLLEIESLKAAIVRQKQKVKCLWKENWHMRMKSI